MKHLVQVETHKTETLYILKFSTKINMGFSTEINMGKCFTLMCLNLNQMLHSNVSQLKNNSRWISNISTKILALTPVGGVLV